MFPVPSLLRRLHPAAMPWLPRAGGPEQGRDGDRGPAGHPRHLPGTLQGNESISFGLNPFSPLSSMEEWKRRKQMGKPLLLEAAFVLIFFFSCFLN